MIPIGRSPNSQFANDLDTPKRMDDLKRLKDLRDKAAGVAMPFNT